MNRLILKKTATILGNIFTLAAVFYLLTNISIHLNKIQVRFSSVLLLIFVLFCFTHFLQTFIIQIILDKKIGYFALLKIHSASQIYKYLPGNVAHYFSRWVYLRQHDVRPRENARLILYETFFLVATFTLFGIAFLVTSPWLQIIAMLPGFEVCVVVGMAALILAGYVFRKKIGFIFTVKTIFLVLLYILAVLISGLILWLLSTYMISGIAGIGFVQYTLGFAVSFLAGFVVPGSPGGIGIREVVFVEIFKHSGTEPYLLTQLIVVFRLMAIVTELLIYFIMNILLKYRR